MSNSVLFRRILILCQVFLVSIVIMGLIQSLGTSGSATSKVGATSTNTKSQIISDNNMRDSNYSDKEVQTFLDTFQGPLKSYIEKIDTVNQKAAITISGYSMHEMINPRVVLALLEMKKELISNPNSIKSVDTALDFDKPDQLGFNKQILNTVTLLNGYMSSYKQNNNQDTLIKFKDGSSILINGNLNNSSYALVRLLAQTTDQATWEIQSGQGPGSFYLTYQKLFGDPFVNKPVANATNTIPTPFLSRPFNKNQLSVPGEADGYKAEDGLTFGLTEIDVGVNTYFDHEFPYNISCTLNDLFFVSFRGKKTAADCDYPYHGARGYSGHTGIDFNLPAGLPALAAATGTAREPVYQSQWAWFIILDHSNFGNYATVYEHLNPPEDENGNLIHSGTTIAQGKKLGTIAAGANLNHLHFEVRNNADRKVDPFGYCNEFGINDPWQDNTSGAPSYWLWQGIESPCPQQNPIDSCNPLNVTKQNDDGTCGTLRHALAAAGSGTEVTISLPANSNKTITIQSSGLNVPAGVTLTGLCINNTTPDITISGTGVSGNGLTLNGGASVYGIKVSGFSGYQIYANPSGTVNNMSCVVFGP